MSFSRKRETHGFLTHNRSCSTLKTLQKRHQKASFLPYNFSRRGSKGRLHNPDKQENIWFATWKRIVSDCARNVPFLPLNYCKSQHYSGENPIIILAAKSFAIARPAE